MNSYRPFLDPLFIAKLSGMLLRARFIVEGFISGLHQSSYKGYSLEFAQHREYSPGDEPKHIDWKVYGKTDRFYVKQYQEETNLKSYILLDTSASMGYGSHGLTKLEYGSYIAAALSYLMIRQNDSVGLVLFNDEIRKFIPPRSNKEHLSVVMKELENLTPANKTKIGNVLKDTGQQIKRRGLIIVISDLFDERAEILNGLKYFRFKKHEVIVLHILDPAEQNLDISGPVIFENLETEEKVLTEPDIIKAEYAELMKNLISGYKLQCEESDIDYSHMDTKTPIDYALGNYLAKRELLI